MSNVLTKLFGKVVPFSKENQKAAADKLAAKVENGEAEPILLYTTVKAIVESLSLFLKNKTVTDAVMNACKKYGKTGAMCQNANICETETGVKYDYSVCNDPEWEELTKKKAELDEALKAREKFLRNIPGTQTILDEETGVVSTISAPAKSSSMTVKVTFAK